MISEVVSYHIGFKIAAIRPKNKIDKIPHMYKIASLSNSLEDKPFQLQFSLISLIRKCYMAKKHNVARDKILMC